MQVVIEVKCVRHTPAPRDMVSVEIMLRGFDNSLSAVFLPDRLPKSMHRKIKVSTEPRG